MKQALASVLKAVAGIAGLIFLLAPVVGMGILVEGERCKIPMAPRHEHEREAAERANPSNTLTAVSVSPQNLSITVNQKWQMTATGTFDDGTQKTLNSGVTWSSSHASSVSVGQTTGVVTGVGLGSATISASAEKCSGSTTITVALQGVNTVTVMPSSQNATRGGRPVSFHATANGSTDITNPAIGTTWTVLDSTGTDQTAKFSPRLVAGTGADTGESFWPNGSVTPGTFTVQATFNGVVGTATLVVN